MLPEERTERAAEKQDVKATRTPACMGISDFPTGNIVRERYSSLHGASSLPWAKRIEPPERKEENTGWCERRAIPSLTLRAVLREFPREPGHGRHAGDRNHHSAQLRFKPCTIALHGLAADTPREKYLRR